MLNKIFRISLKKSLTKTYKIQKLPKKSFIINNLIKKTKKNFQISTPILNDAQMLKNKKNHEKINSDYKSLLLKNTSYKLNLPKSSDKKKKVPTRQRIESILDSGSFFLELSQLAGHDLYDKDITLAGGLITGVGLINKKLTMIIANDYSQKGGSYFPITVKKEIRAQEIAERLYLPCLYLVDSAGANLPRQDEVFPDRDHFGRIFFNISRMSKKGIPQIAAVLGSCTAGGAYVPAMCDKSVIVQNQGTVFLGGPPLVKAATGEIVTAEELGGGDTHTKISGVCDYLAKDEFHAFKLIRDIFKEIDTTFDFKYHKQYFEQTNNQETRDSLKQLEYLMDPDFKVPIDSKELILRLSDNKKFSEYKPDFGKTIITGTLSLLGQEIGIIANNGVLFSESALKASHFIQLCNQQNRPLLFLQNITGFMIGKKYEHEGIAKHGAKLVNAVANATVPKITLIFGASYGAGNYGMCGRAYSPEFLFSWPMSRLSVMGGEQAAKVMTAVKKGLGEREREEYFLSLRDRYERESRCVYGTARLWDDGVCMVEDTREVLGLSFMIAGNNRGVQGTVGGEGFGVFRM